jgi:hypothetical protein
MTSRIAEVIVFPFANRVMFANDGHVSSAVGRKE